MAERQLENQIQLEQRQQLLQTFPCFANYSLVEIRQLANLLTEWKYEAGEIIVVENALIENVYLIASGQLEVTREIKIKNKLTQKIKASIVPVAVLYEGDAIGLNETGFFSTTGKRTATVRAITDAILLRLDLHDLQHFLQQHAHLQATLYTSAEHMLRMQLIKHILPFSRLSAERLKWLAERVETVGANEGDIIFHQGDKGECCYLIRSGQIEISAEDKEGNPHQLAILSSPALFGEATLMTHSPRNATARALKKTELFMLRHEYVTELIEKDQDVAQIFMLLMVDRSRPLQCDTVTVHPRLAADEQEIFILKNSKNGAYFQLSMEGWFIWQQLNGEQTLREITLALAQQFNIFAPDLVAGLISKLAKAGFIQRVELTDSRQGFAQPRWMRLFNQIRRCLEARVAIGDADRALSYWYHKIIWIFFTRWGQFILAFCSIAGLAAFLFSTNSTIETFDILPDTWVLLLCLIPAMLLSVTLHELGHAFTTKAFGQEVHYMGIGWYWLGPIAFTDTSDMWLSHRWPRMVVNLAGIYTDCIVAGVVALIILLMSNPYIQAFLWLFALLTYLSAFRMLNPLQELDGYYFLMDYLEKPRLRQTAVIWLIKDFPKAIRQPRLFRHHSAEVIYWLAAIGFLFSTTFVTYFVQAFIFKIIGLHFNLIISLILPFAVLFISSLGVIAEIRSQKEELI